MCDTSRTGYDGGNSMQNPLLKFKLSSLKTQRYSSHLKQLAAGRKLNTALYSMDSVEVLRVRPYCRVNANHVPVKPMLNSIERKILSFLPKSQVKRHPMIVETFIEDVRKHYDQVMLKYSNKDTNRQEHTLESKQVSVEKNDANQTKNVIKACEQFEKRFLLAQKPLRTALEFIILELLPFNLRLPLSNRGSCLQRFQARSAISYRLLVNSIRRDIEDYNNWLHLTWYSELIAILKQQMGRMDNGSHIYDCLEGLIIRQIIEMKQNALTNLLEMLSDERTIPMLRFNLEVHKNRIVLNPTLEALEKIFVSLAFNIANIGIEMLPKVNSELNPYEFANTKNSEYIKLKMNEIYVAELIADIKHTVRSTYEPIMSYAAKFHSRYERLFTFPNGVDALANLTCNFKSLFTTIEDNSKIKTMLQFESKHVYFRLATIQNESALQQLANIIEEQRRQSLKKLTTQHIALLQEICTDFETFMSRVLKIPRSTEELLALKEFVNKSELKQFHESVTSAQHLSNKLLEVTDLSETHLALSIRTLNWLREIEVVRDMAATQLDHFEALFKAHLRTLEEKSNNDIGKLVERVQLFRSLTDFPKSREQRVFIQSVARQLNELEDCVSWINKEECLLGRSKSRFLALDDVRETVRKFVK